MSAIVTLTEKEWSFYGIFLKIIMHGKELTMNREQIIGVSNFNISSSTVYDTINRYKKLVQHIIWTSKIFSTHEKRSDILSNT